MSLLLLPLLFVASFSVDVTLDNPPTVAGNCNPTRVHITGRLTATAPGKVSYVWLRSDKGASSVQSLEFRKAGPLPVSYDWLVRSSYSGWVALKVLTPAPEESRKIKFDVVCK